jgi:hypothetical protein
MQPKKNWRISFDAPGNLFRGRTGISICSVLCIQPQEEKYGEKKRDNPFWFGLVG